MRMIEPAQPADSTAINEHRISGPDEKGHDEEPKNDDNDEKLDDGGEDDYDEEYDLQAEAEAAAQALGNQIWAELGQSFVSAGTEAIARPATETTQTRSLGGLSSDPNPSFSGSMQIASLSSDSPCSSSPHQLPQASPEPSAILPPTPDPMIETIKTMLSLALSDPHVHYALMSTIVPGPVANGANLYTILSRSVMEGRVNPELAQPLSILISALASGSMMISAEASQSAPPSPGTSLKRKRGSFDEGQVWSQRSHSVYNSGILPTHAPRPTRTQQATELLDRLQAAASEIVRVLDPLLVSNQPLNESIVSPIQRQLGQIYAFASSCAQPMSEAGTVDNTLQEISGLIQVIGILSGVPIAQSPDSASQTDGSPSTGPNRGGQPSRSPNNAIGTAVYPCPSCSRLFCKLSSLRAHERTHTEGRPFRCEYTGCPASFARNHDLRRHEKSHERQMFKCRGCDKLFSRRDALRRHKTNEKAPSECREAPIDTSTVQHDGEPPRVTRVWQNHSEVGDWSRDSEVEDGEIQTERHVTGGFHTGEPISSSDERPAEGQPPPERPLSTQRDTDGTPHSDMPAIASQDDSAIDGSRGGPASHKATLDLQAAIALPGYGLDDEHTNMLEKAIAVAAQAAQAQAEAEAALYEEYDEDEQEGGEWDEHESDYQAEPKRNELVH